MVGAGGIGCELLKNLALVNTGEIHIVDLDTIDLSNLNRQFLFRKEHIKKSKALVAKESAASFNPNVNIVAYHANIKDAQFSVKWFSGFDLVFNALDNLDARRHVNRMCLAASTPLIESGTAGFNGQVQVIMPGKTECYDCNPKPIPKTFAVCTIRSTPSQPIHCIVWAKSYLFSQLFESEAEVEANGAGGVDDPGDDAAEKEELMKEANELKEIRDAISESNFAEKMFNKVFKTDIERLLSMDGMWKTRKPPVALNYKDLVQKSKELDAKEVLSKEHQTWSLEENFAVFLDALTRLLDRKKELAPDIGLVFDKDDEDTLDFVVAAANIRCHVFFIERKSKFDIKQIAGNIIPAIATTNAIIAGVCLLQSFKVFEDKLDEARMVFLSKQPDRVFSTEKLHEPNPKCVVCGVARAVVKVDTDKLTLGELIDSLLKLDLGYSDELSIVTDKLIYDPDFDDNISRTLSDLKISDGSFFTVIDEEEEDVKVNLELYFEHDPSAGDKCLLQTEPNLKIKPVDLKLESEYAGNDDNELKRPHEVEAGAEKRRKLESGDAAVDNQEEEQEAVIIIDEDDGVVELE